MTRSVCVVAVILCEIVYLGYFYSLELPNAVSLDAHGGRLSRPSVLVVSIPGLVPDAEAPLVWAARQMVSGANLIQRIPVVLYAGLIILAAYGVGDLVLRGVRSSAPDEGDSSSERLWLAAEQLVFAWGIGSSLLATATLAVGLLGWMPRVVIVPLLGLAALRIVWRIGVQMPVWRIRLLASVSKATGSTPGLDRGERNKSAARIPGVIWLGAVTSGLFLALGLLGALLPATDFDVLQYHLQGPKEYFQAGRISFASHNIYMNMPFETGMLSLLSMIVAGDWWWGGLVGQAVLAWFAPATVVAVLLVGRRCFGVQAGLLAALIYVSCPWLYRITVIPHTENALSFFLVSAVLAGRRAVDLQGRGLSFPDVFLAGVMAGSAGACKYTALLSTILPCGIGSVILAGRFWSSSRRSARPGNNVWIGPVAVGLGVALVLAPWLIRNAAWTGNPTYPLLYQQFGGRNWTPEKNARWEWGHRIALLVASGIQRPPADRPFDPHDAQHAIGVRQLWRDLNNVTVQSDWLSPLLFSLAPLAVVGPRGRRSARWLWLLIAFLFLQWWLLTHRYDRFWVPMLPLVAVLAGGGCLWTTRFAWRVWLYLMIPLVLFLDLSYCTTSLCGFNQFGMALVPHRHPYDPSANWLADHVPPTGRVLAVADTAQFHFAGDLEYSTVFDDCWLADWFGRSASAQEIAAELERRKITRILVNWSAIQYHLSPDGYGFSRHLTPGRFQLLVDRGVLRRIPHEIADAAERVSVGDQVVAPREVFAVVAGAN